MKFLGSIWSGSGRRQIKKRCYKAQEGYLVKYSDSFVCFKELKFKNSKHFGISISSKTKFKIWLFFQSGNVRLDDE